MNKLYFPSYSLNIMPKIIHILPLFFLFLPLHDVLVTNERSSNIMIEIFIIGFLLLFYYITWGIMYCFLKRNAWILHINKPKMFVLKKKKSKEYNLEEIDHFVVVCTEYLAASGPANQIELFINDIRGNTKRIHYNEIANNLRNAWKIFGNQLRDATEKEVVFKDYVEDIDGEIIETNEYRKHRFRKRLKMFDNPYR